jgi:FemAB-related protein (PEP-CTERM system-associated)
MTIRRLNDFPDQRWNRFVMAHDDATCFHLSEWAEVSMSLCGWDPYYLYIEQGGTIRAVLPLVHVKNRFSRGALVSTPFCVYGGALAEDAEMMQVIENAAAQLARDLGVAHLEVRQSIRPNPQWTTTDLYYTFKKQLVDDIDVNLAAVPRKQRAMVRKGASAGLTASFGRNQETFYDLFAIGMRNLGTPVYPRQLFTALERIFGDALDILIVEREGRPLAAVLSLYFRDEVLPYYAGGMPEARNCAAFDFMYWKLMCHAVEKGARNFDFGRSMRDSGAFAFKKNWGFEPRSLQYQYDVLDGHRSPVMDPSRPIFKTLTAVWRRLPLSIANTIGPMVSPRLY